MPYGPPPIMRPYGPPMPYGRPMPPPRSGGGGIAALFTVLGVFLVVGLLVAAGFAASSSERSTTAYTPTYTPSFTYSPATTPSTYSSSPTTSRSASTSRTTGHRTTTSTKPAGPQPVIALGNHPMFSDTSIGLNNVRCNLPAFALDPAVARAFFESASTCLDQMWQRDLGVTNLPFSSPGLQVAYSPEQLSSPCGSSGSAAFYCSSSKTIYMSTSEYGKGRTNFPAMEALAIFAHEYGHHVQALTGLLRASHDQRYDHGASTPLGLETSRRMELQASCFGGMYLGSAQAAGSYSTDEAWTAIRDHYNRGDYPGRPRDHGSPDNNGWWYEHGYTTNRNFECNTWLAPSDSVS